MAFHYGGRIVRDGLVLHINPADKNSYIGSGTTIKDLSGNSNDATLLNGVGYSNGTFVFDGVNDMISRSALPITLGETMMCWFNVDTIKTSGEDWLLSQYDLGLVGRTIFNIQGVGLGEPKLRYFIGGNAIYSTTTILTGVNYFGCVTRDINGTTKIYINGVEENSATLNTNSISITDFEIGNTIKLTTRQSDGKIGDILVYNRALTQEEILQNYNATKGRYGLS